MKLPDLLTQITPLEIDSEQPLTRAYVKHASTLFPELVKALEDLNCWLIAPDTSPEILAQMKIKCAYALARANEIKI